MSRDIPGINIQWPWSQLLLVGKKTIETRSYSLPEKFRDVELAVIETPGPRGKKEAGILESRIIGTIVFSRSFRYSTKNEWMKDQDKHLVLPSDPQFAFLSGKEKWGWVVKEVTLFERPKPRPSKTGIIFSKSCRI